MKAWSAIILTVIVVAVCIVVAAWGLVWLLRAMLGGVTRMLRGGPGADGGLPCRRRRGGSATNVRLVCPNKRCRHVNRAEAVFCSQCGQRL